VDTVEKKKRKDKFGGVLDGKLILHTLDILIAEYRG
jgi:hypothetical protein